MSSLVQHALEAAVASLRKKLASTFLGPIPLSRQRAMGISERLSAVTALTGSLEHLSRLRHIEPGGLNDWQIARDNYIHKNRITRRALDVLARKEVTVGLQAARAAAAAGLLLPGNGRWRGAANLFLGVSGAALYPRYRHGTDGADQASTMVQSATGLARLSGDERTQDALLWYVAMQNNLSYLISGWVKLLGKDWRTGDALGGVMRTRTYGERHIWEMTQKYPRASRTLAHGVLALECLFPVLYLNGGKLAKPVIGSAAAFHLANGSVMGLGRFATSFVSMHPMVAYTSAPRSHPAVAGRDDRAVGAAALAVAAAVAFAGAVAASRRSRTNDPAPGSRSLTTRHGNELSYTPRVSEQSDAPVVVFLHGLAATPEHFGWITEKLLQDSDADVVTYSRAGYGASKHRSQRPFSLQESVDDLVDLVREAVPEGRRVVLAGHSLGGELARRAAAQLGEQLHAVVYLDSSHPAELQRSEQQSDSAEQVGAGLRSFARSLRGGFGFLLEVPDWVKNLPAAHRSRVMAQYGDTRLWNAGVREWESTEREFRDFAGELETQDSHALVISAQKTVDRDPDHLLMHKEMADAHLGGPGRVVRSEVIEGADHDSLLTRGRHALEAGNRIIAFLAETAAAETAPAETADAAADTDRVEPAGQPAPTDRNAPATARPGGSAEKLEDAR
ncbi:alpha/beta fold hydrolase [Streptomyces otsuchiensis]|uniref:alpha/beta fold hydrolase n=1 Tax=Streptomyces otsuchiensis TaxID=2681388 RepID=UPI001031E492|nr:alpha/beta fold hydrolase [Streptomyces otsuchiensis]